MKKLAFVLASATALISASASAADLRRPIAQAPGVAAAPYFNWTGCHIGVQGGYAWGRSRHINQVGGVTTDITDRYDLSGGLVGPTLGCNIQTGAFVFGVEGDWSWSWKEGGGNGIPPFDTNAISQTRENWLATIRGRVGWAWDRWMLYATGGLAIADVEASVIPNPASGLATIAESKTRTGWTVGGGLEWAFAPNWSAKLEYLHVALQNEGYFLTPPAGFANRAGGVPLHNDIIRAGINYRFNWGGPVVARY